MCPRVFRSQARARVSKALGVHSPVIETKTYDLLLTYRDNSRGDVTFHFSFFDTTWKELNCITFNTKFFVMTFYIVKKIFNVKLISFISF